MEINAITKEQSYLFEGTEQELKMDILGMRVLRGPNYWSNYRKQLIFLKIDLKEFEELPTDMIEGFNDRLKELMPSLYHHHCSPGVPGGFFTRLERGTWLGHVIEHIALELQWLAGMECGYGRTRSANEHGVYNIVFSYEIESAGMYAAEAAIRIVETLANKRPYLALDLDIEKLQQIHHDERLGPSTESLVQEAEKRGIPCTRLDNHSLIMLGYGARQKFVWSTITSETSTLGVDIVCDKEKTKEMLAAALISVPKGLVITSTLDIDHAIATLGFPLVVKPQMGNHGKGITTNITTREKALLAFRIAQDFSNHIIIERFIEGFDFRVLVVNFKLVAVAKRIPAMVIGDGQSTIQELIDETNKNPHRGVGHQNYLTKIVIDDVTCAILLENGLSPDSVLPAGKTFYLKDAANISTGGTAIDVTDQVHPQNILMAERIARLVNLDICGIDIITDDISTPITERNGAVVEVNAGPGFRMHLAPSEGKKRNVAKPVIDMLFPESKDSRIPLVAVTGTNGKTTIVRLVAHLATMAGRSVGFTTTEGIYLQNQQIFKGDCSGPRSAAVILRDPIVDYAVLECARGGILRSGLGFDKSSISIITNVSEDHLGLDDIKTLEEMARVKSVVARSTLEDGYAILNADDDLVYAMRVELDCHVALFSMNSDSARINAHCKEGGLAAYLESDSIYVQRGEEKQFVTTSSEIPLTFGGTARCMIKNLLPAVLAGVVSGYTAENISKWLKSFQVTSENIPGRMNLFTFDHFKVLIDYAHNEQAFIELRDFINSIDANKKVGIIAATGDRRTEDIKKVGFYAAQTFDEIIIRQDRDSRGRTHEELTDLIIDGIKAYDENSDVKVIPNEFDAIQYAMDNAIPDTFIMYFPDEILKACEYVKKAGNGARG